MSARRLIIFAFVGVLIALAPLAYADPPDPSWIGGFYDDDDFDDAVILASSMLGTYEAWCPLDLEPDWLYVQPVICAEMQAPATPVSWSAATRAPPSVLA